MKKLSLIVLCAAALLCSQPASAEINFGLRAGLNLVNNNINELKLDNARNKDNYTGFFAGPSMEIGLPFGLSIDAAAMYSQKGMEFDKETVKNQSIAVPLSLRFTLGLGDIIGVFAQAGPQVNFNIGDAEHIFSNGTKYIQEKSVWTMNVGAGVKLFSSFEIAANYNMPLSHDGAFQMSDMTDMQFESKTLQISLTYRF